MTADHLLAAARELRSRPTEQREQLFDELLQQAEQSELTRARQALPPPAPDEAPPEAVADEAPGKTPERAAFWGDADRNAVRVVAAAGGLSSFVITIAAGLAAGVAVLAAGGPSLASFGYTALYGAGFALLLLLLLTFTIEVDRSRRTLRVYRSPVSLISFECPLSDARAEPRTTQIPGMGGLGRDFRVYLRGSNGVDHLLFKGRKRTARADRILARLEQLLNPPAKRV